MKISVITVCYNSVSTIEATILSVLQQSYATIEYIVVDGDSNDGTKSVLEKYRDKITKIVSEKDKGLYDALNKGIKLATGDVIAFLHADDFYTDPLVVEKYVKVFVGGNYDAVYANLFYVDADDTTKVKRKWNSGEYNHGAFLNGWMPPHPTLFVRKEIYEKYGSFNTDFKTSADYELMLRLIHKHKIKLGYLKEFAVKMRVGGQSNASLNNRIKANLEDRRAWEVNQLKPRFYTLLLKPFRKITQFF